MDVSSAAPVNLALEVLTKTLDAQMEMAQKLISLQAQMGVDAIKSQQMAQAMHIVDTYA